MKTAFVWISILSAMHPLEEPVTSNNATSSLVTLRNQSISLAKALHELTNQTGNHIVDLRREQGQSVTNPNLTLDFDRVPFWQALDQIAKQANVGVYPYAGSRGVGIIGHRTPVDEPVCYSGPFRIVLKETVSKLNHGTGDVELSSVLEFACEPRFNPIFLKLVPNTIQATTIPPEIQQSVPAPFQSVRHHGLAAKEIGLPLGRSRQPSAVLSALQGEVQALVSPGFIEHKFNPLAAGSRHESRGISLELNRVEDADGLLTVSTRLGYGPENLDPESHQTWLAEDNEAEILVNGRIYKPKGRAISIEDDGVIETTYRFANLPNADRGRTFIARVLAPPVKVPVKFRFIGLAAPSNY